MDIRGLKYLLTIADCASVPRAAEVMGVSRQSVGKELRHLEAETGIRLFDRRGGELVPTDECAAMLKDARDVVDRFDDLCLCHFRSLGIPRSRGAHTQGPGTLNVAMVVGCTKALPEKFYESFLALDPGVNLNVEEMSTDAVLSNVADGKFDIGIVGSHPELLEGFDCCHLVTSDVWILVPENDPLTQKASFSLADLADRSFVTPGSHNHVHRFVSKRCALSGISFNVVGTSTDSTTLMNLAAEHNALCFGFSPSVSPAPSGMVARPLCIEGSHDFGTYAIRRAYSAGQKVTGNVRSQAGTLFWDMCRAISSRNRNAND